MRLLDLYCGAGGAAVGYRRAGFLITGVDLAAQPRYPYQFIRGDALTVLSEIRSGAYHAIHASPPCKVHTSLKAFSGAQHVDLIGATRDLLISSGLPWIMENVPGAPLVDPVVLCGSSFGLGVRRHRLFESNIDLAGLPCDHVGQASSSPGYPVLRYHSGRPVTVMSPVVGVYGRGQGLGAGEVELWKRAMGIDWMTRDEMREAIPPAYTEHLGTQLIRKIK